MELQYSVSLHPWPTSLVLPEVHYMKKAAALRSLYSPFCVSILIDGFFTTPTVASFLHTEELLVFQEKAFGKANLEQQLYLVMVCYHIKDKLQIHTVDLNLSPPLQDAVTDGWMRESLTSLSPR